MPYTTDDQGLCNLKRNYLGNGSEYIKKNLLTLVAMDIELVHFCRIVVKFADDLAD